MTKIVPFPNIDADYARLARADRMTLAELIDFAHLFTSQALSLLPAHEREGLRLHLSRAEANLAFACVDVYAELEAQSHEG